MIYGVLLLLLLGLVLIIWNVRLAKRASSAERMNEVLEGAQKLQRKAAEIRARKRRTGSDLLDSLQERGGSSDSS